MSNQRVHRILSTVAVVLYISTLFVILGVYPPAIPVVLTANTIFLFCVFAYKSVRFDRDRRDLLDVEINRIRQMTGE